MKKNIIYCETCGDQITPEEYKENPNRTCLTCGDCNWSEVDEGLLGGIGIDESYIKTFDKFID